MFRFRTSLLRSSRCLLPLFIAAGFAGLACSCEDESADSAYGPVYAPGGSGGTSGTDQKPSGTNTGGSDEQLPMGSTNTPAGTDTNAWSLVDAANYRQTNGTYLADGLVFTNCNGLAVYLLNTTNHYILTNCDLPPVPG